MIPDDMPPLPDFLRRPPITPEQRARLERQVAETVSRKIKSPSRIKNPPKQAKKSAAMLGVSPVGMRRK